jgi:SAM-dependent methyltransferase
MVGASSSAGDPSAFFLAHAERLRATAAIGPVLDLASGRGRHSLAAARLGLDVLAVDRNAESLTELSGCTAAPGRIETRLLDLEGVGTPALGARGFGAILVFRYLHRPLTAWIESLLSPGGLLLYETFTTHQRRLGWGPSREAFLLAPGELPQLFPNLLIERYDEGPTDEARPAQTGRLVALRPV